MIATHQRPDAEAIVTDAVRIATEGVQDLVEARDEAVGKAVNRRRPLASTGAE